MSEWDKWVVVIEHEYNDGITRQVVGPYPSQEAAQAAWRTRQPEIAALIDRGHGVVVGGAYAPLYPAPTGVADD